MPRRDRTPRNTAPIWKKLTLVVATFASAAFVSSVLGEAGWGGGSRALVSVAVGVAVLWSVARLLRVRLSLRSWD